MEDEKWVFAIVDTHFILDNSHKLELILKYMNNNIYNEPFLNSIRFIIPFIVFQELDKLNVFLAFFNYFHRKKMTGIYLQELIMQ